MMEIISNQLAYIDPGTASQIVAVISGIVITCAVALGVMRTRIAMFFQKRKINRMEKQIMKENDRNQGQEGKN